VFWHVHRARDFTLPAASYVTQTDGEAEMIAEVIGDVFAHVDTCGFCAEDADVEILRVHQTHGGWRQGDYDGPVLLGLRMGDGELAPGFVDSGMEEAELEVALDGDMLGKTMGVAGGWFDEYILTIKT
jgi:hypothetical protein